MTGAMATGRPQETTSNPAGAPGRTHPAVFAVSSALMLFFAFPPSDQGYLAWVALVPLFLLVEDDRRPRTLYLSAWLGGLVFWGLAISWVAWVHLGGHLIMATALSLGWPLFLFLARVATRRLRLPFMLGVPVVWLALEYGRTFMLSGFPWFFLAHSQYRYLVLIQISDLAGAWGLSLLIAVFNAWVVDLVRRPLLAPTPAGPRVTGMQKRRLAVVASLLGATLIYGASRLATYRSRTGPRLALIQTDFPQALHVHRPIEQVLGELSRLVGKALTEHSDRPDLIVWPESSFPPGILRIDPSLAPADFAKQIEGLDPGASPAEIRARQRETDASLREMVDNTGVPIVIGTITYDFGPKGLSKFNTAALLRPGGNATTSYHKQLLVPFGEYIPLFQFAHAFLWLTPFQDGYVPLLSAGSEQTWFDVGGYRYAPLICFEDGAPDLARRAFVGKGRSHPPEVLLNLTNDGWFHGSSEHQTHLALSVFRAVECRTPLARAVNTGITALIDGNGAILARLPRETSGELSVEVPLDDRSSAYLLCGDWLPMTCAAISIGLVPVSWLRRRRTS